MARPTPVGAFCSGLAAGLVGSLARSLFFGATRRIAPSSPPHAFEPPPDERNASETVRVARRAVEGLARPGDLEHESAAANVVHYAFGAAWGALYGLWSGTWKPERPLRSGAVFGVVVWMASDNALLPLFRLAAWPWRYPIRTHAYAIAAHLAYGASVAYTYDAAQRIARAKRPRGRLPRPNLF